MPVDRLGQIFSFLAISLLAAHQHAFANDPTKLLAQAKGRVFSRAGSSQVLVIKRGNQLFLETSVDGQKTKLPLPGSFVWTLKSMSGLQLRDLTGDGLSEIIYATSDGASEGANVRAFRAIGKNLTPMLSDRATDLA